MSFRLVVRRAAVICGAGVLLTGCAKSPEGTVEAFYRAVAEGELKDAQSYLSKDIVELMGEQKLSDGLSKETQRAQNCGGIKDVQIQMQEGAEVRYGRVTLAYANCPDKVENVKLVKEDGSWKIGVEK
jgi:hypothetical protein